MGNGSRATSRKVAVGAQDSGPIRPGSDERIRLESYAAGRTTKGRRGDDVGGRKAHRGAMSTISINANQLRPGDFVEYGGRQHRITDVVRRAGFSWPVAVDGTGWAMALDQRTITVRRGEPRRHVPRMALR